MTRKAHLVALALGLIVSTITTITSPNNTDNHTLATTVFFIIWIFGYAFIISAFKFAGFLDSDSPKAKSEDGFAYYLLLTITFIILGYFIPILLVLAAYTAYQSQLSNKVDHFDEKTKLMSPVCLTFIYALTLPIVYAGALSWLSSSGEVQYFGYKLPSPIGYIYAIYCYSVHILVASMIAAKGINLRDKWAKIE